MQFSETLSTEQHAVLLHHKCALQVKPELVQKLAFYLWFAEYSYEAGTEPNLKKILTQRAFELNFAKMNATWGEHEPAYYVATHTKSKEMLVVVRGTWTMEDVVTDITALPVVSRLTMHEVMDMFMCCTNTCQ